MSLYLTLSFPVTVSVHLVSVPLPMLPSLCRTAGVSLKVPFAAVLKTSSFALLVFAAVKYERKCTI